MSCRYPQFKIPAIAAFIYIILIKTIPPLLSTSVVASLYVHPHVPPSAWPRCQRSLTRARTTSSWDLRPAQRVPQRSLLYPQIRVTRPISPRRLSDPRSPPRPEVCMLTGPRLPPSRVCNPYHLTCPIVTQKRVADSPCLACIPRRPRSAGCAKTSSPCDDQP